MKAKTYAALNTLLSVSLHTDDLESFNALIVEHQSEFVEALQHISDSENEAALDAAHFGLYINSDDDTVDEHIGKCLFSYLSIIEIADEEYSGDISSAVSQVLNQETEEASSDDIAFLENCLTIPSHHHQHQ